MWEHPFPQLLKLRRTLVKLTYKNERGKILLSEAGKDRVFGYALLLPTFLVFALVIMYPILNGVVMSFSDYSYFTVSRGEGFRWNNFANYKTIMENGFAKQLRKTITFTLATVLAELIIGMSIAIMLNSNKIQRGRGLLRSLFLMPWTIPSIVVALLWNWLFNSSFGVWNYIFGTPNMEWIQNPKTAMFTVVVACVWRQTPYMLIMLLAALQNVNQDLIEAATIDGANTFQIFWHITLPSIKQVLGTTVITCIMSSFQQFTIIYQMTNGGPVDTTTTMSIGAYKLAFTNMDLGAGAAVGVIWMIILIVGVSIFNTKTKRFDNV